MKCRRMWSCLNFTRITAVARDVQEELDVTIGEVCCCSTCSLIRAQMNSVLQPQTTSAGWKRTETNTPSGWRTPDAENDTYIAATTENENEKSISSVDGVSISYIFIGVVGILGNLFATFILVKFKKKNFFHILLINQCLVDCLTSAFLVATSLNSLYNSSGNFGLRGTLNCFLWNNKIILWSLFLCSTYNLVAVNLERYLEVVFPIFHKTKLSRIHLCVVLIIVWSIGFVYNLAYKTPTSFIQDGVCMYLKKWPSESIRRFVGILNAVLYFFIPVFVMTFVSLSIVRVLKRRTQVGNSNTVSIQIQRLQCIQSFIQRETVWVGEDKWSQLHRESSFLKDYPTCCFISRYKVRVTCINFWVMNPDLHLCFLVIMSTCVCSLLFHHSLSVMYLWRRASPSVCCPWTTLFMRTTSHGRTQNWVLQRATWHLHLNLAVFAYRAQATKSRELSNSFLAKAQVTKEKKSEWKRYRGTQNHCAKHMCVLLREKSYFLTKRVCRKSPRSLQICRRYELPGSRCELRQRLKRFSMPEKFFFWILLWHSSNKSDNFCKSARMAFCLLRQNNKVTSLSGKQS